MPTIIQIGTPSDVRAANSHQSTALVSYCPTVLVANCPPGGVVHPLLLTVAIIPHVSFRNNLSHTLVSTSRQLICIWGIYIYIYMCACICTHIEHRLLNLLVSRSSIA